MGQLGQPPSQTPWGIPSPPSACTGGLKTCFNLHPHSHSNPSLWLCLFSLQTYCGSPVLLGSVASGMPLLTAKPWAHPSQPWVPEATSNGQGGRSAKGSPCSGPEARNTEVAVCPGAHQRVGEREPWPSAYMMLTLPAGGGGERRCVGAPAPHSSIHGACAGGPAPAPVLARAVCVH